MAFFGPPIAVIVNVLPRWRLYRDEELFHLGQQSSADLLDRFDVFVLIRMNGHAQQAVILLFLAPLDLLGGNDPDDAHVDQAADMRRRIHQDKNVNRIAVLAEGRRNEPEVERKEHALRQQATKFEESGVRVVRELVAKALRRLDNGPARSLFRIELVRKTNQVGHGRSLLRTAPVCAITI